MIKEEIKKTKKEWITDAEIYLASKGINVSDKFEEWVKRKANSLHCRDRKKAIKRNKTFVYTKYHYVIGICQAIIRKDCGSDFYTGENLRWDLIGRYENEESMQNGKEYKQQFSLMPTVDHIDAEQEPNFVICSWRMNDAKNDLSLTNFKRLCEVFLEYQVNGVKEQQDY